MSKLSSIPKYLYVFLGSSSLISLLLLLLLLLYHLYEGYLQLHTETSHVSRVYSFTAIP